jgi:hypothetical protein
MKLYAIYGIAVHERHYAFAVYIYASNEREFSFCGDDFPAQRHDNGKRRRKSCFHMRENFPESAKLNKFQ